MAITRTKRNKQHDKDVVFNFINELLLSFYFSLGFSSQKKIQIGAFPREMPLLPTLEETSKNTK